MRTTKTIEVAPLGMPIDIYIGIDWSSDPTVNHTDVKGWEYDEAQAVADFWEAVDAEGEATTRGVIDQLAEMKCTVREAIAAAVAKKVDGMELVADDEGDDYEGSDDDE